MTKKLSLTQTLIDSQKTRKQITGHYIERNWDNQKNGKVEITGYCAMGALFCEAGEVNYAGNTMIESKDLFMKKYGVKKQVYEDTFDCPHCDIPSIYLGSFIVHLNDAHGRTFKQIGTHLKKLGIK